MGVITVEEARKYIAKDKELDAEAIRRKANRISKAAIKEATALRKAARDHENEARNATWNPVWNELKVAVKDRDIRVKKMENAAEMLRRKEARAEISRLKKTEATAAKEEQKRLKQEQKALAKTDNTSKSAARSADSNAPTA